MIKNRYGCNDTHDPPLDETGAHCLLVMMGWMSMTRGQGGSWKTVYAPMVQSEEKQRIKKSKGPQLMRVGLM